MTDPRPLVDIVPSYLLDHRRTAAYLRNDPLQERYCQDFDTLVEIIRLLERRIDDAKNDFLFIQQISDRASVSRQCEHALTSLSKL